MAKFNIVHRCYNCGEILQSEDPNAIGYVDASLLDEANPSTVLFCEKCFEEQKYNFVPPIPDVSKDYLLILKDAEASDALIVYVVDLFSFETSFNPEITSIVRNNPFLIIANKRDLMPVGAKDDRLKEYVAHRFRVAGIPAKSTDVFLTSLTSGSNVDAIGDEIGKRRAGHDVYFVGAKGAGKTLFLSSALKNFTNNSRRNITTSFYPGTQLKVMQIPLSASCSLYDTPGTSMDSSIISKLDGVSAKELNDFGALKKRKKSLSKDTHLMIGGIIRIDLLSEEPVDLNCYFPRNATIERLKDKQMKKLIDRNFKDDDLFPLSKEVNSINDFDIFDLEIEEQGSRDIGICGLGWFNFNGEHQVFRIYVPKGIALYTSRAKVED